MASKKSGRNKGKAASPKTLKIKDDIDQPTPEQAGRVEYLRAAVRSEMGQTLGFAYQRRPLIETMAARGGIAPNELAALRHYRTLFDRCEQSPTKSCLNIGAGGSSRTPFNELAYTPGSVTDAKFRVAMCERILGPYLATMRGLVLHDRSISDLAIERFGSRTSSWRIVREPVMLNGRQAVVNGEPQYRDVKREKLVPKSGKHREIIRQEFLAGMHALTRSLADATNMKGIREIWIDVAEDGGARLAIGQCSPVRSYRLWGSINDMEHVLHLVKWKFGKGHRFENAEVARKALDEAAVAATKTGSRVCYLEKDELAA